VFSREIDGGWPQCLQLFDLIYFDSDTIENGGGYAHFVHIVSRLGAFQNSLSQIDGQKIEIQT
jgi:hypothetical protein